MEHREAEPGPGAFRGILCLAGPPGTGKTTAGTVVSGRLGIPFADLDTLVETSAGMTIPEIFRVQGEAGFRRRELSCLRLAVEGAPSVLAVGGGCLLAPEALETVLENTVLVTLSAPVDTLMERCRGGARPLAATGTDLRTLLESRRDHYMSLPNRVETEGLSPDQVADRILEVLRDYLPGDP